MVPQFLRLQGRRAASRKASNTCIRSFLALIAPSLKGFTFGWKRLDMGYHVSAHPRVQLF